MSGCAAKCACCQSLVLVSSANTNGVFDMGSGLQIVVCRLEHVAEDGIKYLAEHLSAMDCQGHRKALLSQGMSIFKLCVLGISHSEVTCIFMFFSTLYLMHSRETHRQSNICFQNISVGDSYDVIHIFEWMMQ